MDVKPNPYETPEAQPRPTAGGWRLRLILAIALSVVGVMGAVGCFLKLFNGQPIRDAMLPGAVGGACLYLARAQWMAFKAPRG